MTKVTIREVKGRIGCETCGHIACVCDVIRDHPNPDCRFRRSTTCPIPVACDHGFDVCPECDPCTCKESA